MNCPKCGNELNPNMKFCAKCGTPVQQPAAPVAPQQPVQQKPVVPAQLKPVAPAPSKETAQPAPKAEPQKPAKQKKAKKKGGKKNIALRVIAIILVIAVLATGGIFITDAILFKSESEKAGYITDFPVLKQDTEFLIYDAEKFPYENYNIKVDRLTNGTLFKSSAFNKFENIINEKSDSPIYNLHFEEDGKYQITLEGIVSERTQPVSTTVAPTVPSNTETTTSSTKSEEPVVIIIIVIVDDNNKDAVDKVTLNSKPGDKIDELVIPSSKPEKKGYIFKNTVSAGMCHSTFLKEDGTVVTVGFDGDDRYKVSEWRNIISVSTGGFHTIGLKTDGTVVSTRISGTAEDVGQANVSGWTDIVEVDAGREFTVGVKSDGSVVAVGLNDFGQCNVRNWDNIVSVSSGEYHTVGLKSDGTVVATGCNDNGQCAVSNWKDVVAVAAGGSYTIGLKSNGTVVVAGDDVNNSATKVSDWTDIVEISAGEAYSIGLKSDGTVVVAGEIIEEEGTEPITIDVSDWEDIVSVSSGYICVMGLKADGTVVSAVNHGSFPDYCFGECMVDSISNVAIPGTEFKYQDAVVETPTQTPEQKDLYSENLKTYQNYLNIALPELVDEGYMDSSRLQTQTNMIDINDDGIYELVLRIVDVGGGGTRGYQTSSYLLGIQNDSVVELSTAYFGGSGGGNYIYVLFDTVQNKHVACVSERSYDGVWCTSGGESLIEYDGVNATVKDRYYCTTYSDYLDNSVYKECVKEIMNETDLYYDSTDEFSERITVYTCNNAYVSKEEFLKNSENRFVNTTDPKYQYQTGTYLKPLAS